MGPSVWTGWPTGRIGRMLIRRRSVRRWKRRSRCGPTLRLRRRLSRISHGVQHRSAVSVLGYGDPGRPVPARPVDERLSLRLRTAVSTAVVLAAAVAPRLQFAGQLRRRTGPARRRGRGRAPARWPAPPYRLGVVRCCRAIAAQRVSSSTGSLRPLNSAVSAAGRRWGAGR